MCLQGIDMKTGEDLPVDIDMNFYKNLVAKLELDAQQARHGGCPGVVGRPSDALGGPEGAREAVRRPGRPWDALGGPERPWDAMGGHGRTSGGPERPWDALGRPGTP